MIEKQIYNLQIDESFRQLIPPLTLTERNHLEGNILKDGCREPLCVWNNIIIDGHNRYEICTRLKIPFYIQQVEFNARDEVIVWICANQLGRRNISDEIRRYLIGKRYEMEKKLGKMNPSGNNQYQNTNVDILSEDDLKIKKSLSKTAEKLGDEYHLSPKTVRKYAAYARSIDTLSNKEPGLISEVLNGNVKISQYNIRKLSKQSPKTINTLKHKLSDNNEKFIPYSSVRKAIPKKKNKASIKDMPMYDPDAEVSSLTFTIPSWVSSIDRALTTANFKLVSGKAKTKLQNELKNLEYTVNVILLAIEEK